VFDGLFGHQLLLLVPLHGRHGADPHDADHGLLGDVGLLHLLFGVGDDLGGGLFHINVAVTKKEEMEIDASDFKPRRFSSTAGDYANLL